MRMTGARQLTAARADVWAKLNDAAVLKRCIPGCTALEKLSDTEFNGTIALNKYGAAAAYGHVKLTDIKPPASYRISGSGKGGPAGMVSGGASVRLEENASGTLLLYNVDATISAPIGRLGQWLIEATAAQFADSLFDNLAREVEGRSAAASAGAVRTL
jgi:carbon monoxide dehydrogenase subunit G